MTENVKQPNVLGQMQNEEERQTTKQKKASYKKHHFFRIVLFHQGVQN